MPDDTRSPYEQYLASDHWQAIRRAAIDVFPNGCIITGSNTFNLHHLNYLKKGRETFWADIIPLQQDKHLEFHEYADKHGLGNHEVLKWIDAMEYKIDADTRRRLESARTYNINLPRKTKIKRKKAKVDAEERREKKRQRKVQSRHLSYYGLEETTIKRGGKEYKVLVKKHPKRRRG